MQRNVFTLIDFALVVTVGHAEKHFLRIAAIGIEFGAQSSISIRNDARVFTGDRTSLFRKDVDPF